MNPLEFRRINYTLMGIMISIGATGHLPCCLGQSELQIDTLVRQLSDDSYATRQRASRMLVELGLGAHFQVVTDALAENPFPPSDLECYLAKKRLLAEIQETRWEMEINRFLHNQQYDQDSLQGWPDFRRYAGDDEDARVLFANALRSQRRLVGRLIDSSAPSGLTLHKRAAAFDSLERRDISAWCVALCCFCNAQSRTSSPESIRMAAVMRSTGLGPNPVRESERRVLARVVSCYLRRAPIDLCDRMVIGVRYGCEELVESDCRQVLSDPSESPARIVTALLVASLQKGLDSEIDGWLNQYRKDFRVSHVWQSMLRPKRTHRTQVRDVALALTFHRSGIDPRSCGFVALLADPILVFQPQSLGFETPQERHDAHQQGLNH